MILFIGQFTCIFVWGLVSAFCCFSAYASMANKSPNTHPLFVNAPLYLETVVDKDQYANGLLSDLTQDKHGFMWIASQRGLVRYDGYKFKQFRKDIANEASLMSDIAIELFIDIHEKIWVSTIHGLSQLDPTTELFTNFEYDNPAVPLPFSYVSTFAAWQQQGFWLATNNGLAFFDFSAGAFTNNHKDIQLPESLKHGVIRHIITLNNGDLIVAGSKGVWRLSSNNYRFHKLLDRKVNHIYEADNGDLWLATDDATLLKIRDNQHIESSRLPQGIITSIVQPNNNELWVAYNFNGIVTIDLNTLKITRHLQQDENAVGGLLSNTIQKLFIDQDKQLWIVTNGKGLQKFSTKNQSFATLRQVENDSTSLSNPEIYSVAEMSNGELWLGHSAGIDIINRLGKRIHTLVPQKSQETNSVQSLSVSAIAQGLNGDVWVGSSVDGLYRIDLASRKTLGWYSTQLGLRNKKIRHVVPVEGGGVWVGSFEGIQYLTPKRDAFLDPTIINGALPDTFVRVTDHQVLESKDIIFTLNNGFLWVEHNSGSRQAYRFVRQSEHTINMPSNLITAVTQSDAGQIWFSGLEGVSLVSKQNNQSIDFTWFASSGEHSEKKAFTNLLTDNQERLWESNLMFSPDDNVVFELESSDGVDIGNDWIGTSFKMRDETLLFGGTTGLLMVWPEFFHVDSGASKLRVTDIEIEGEKRLVNGADIRLTESERRLSIEVALLDYNQPVDTKYRYRMFSESDKWRDLKSGNRLISFTNLPTGKHMLEVQAGNRLNQWGGHNIKLYIEVTPKYYEKTWFLITGFILTCLLIYIAYRWKLNQVLAQSQNLFTRKLEVQRLQNIEQQLEERIRSESILAESNLALEEQKKKAERATLAKSRFLANMSHEIRTPMNAVIGMAYLMSRTVLTQHQQSYLKSIQSSADGLLSVINDVLTLSKIEADAMELHVSVFSIRRLLHESISVLHYMASSKGLFLRAILSDDFPEYICADKGKLKQILVNLIANAVKFTHVGGVEVIGNCVALPNGECQISIVVKDTGQGIDDKNISEICNAFVQVDDSRTRVTEGTGLGLRITSQLLSLMGSSIEIKSALGKGSEFSFNVVVKESTEREENSLPQPESHDENQKVANAQVLVVDDHKINRMLLKALLDEAGLIVVESDNGVDAINMCRIHQFHVILMDVHMPNLDGYQVTAKIRALPSYHDTPIIAVTASAFDADREKAFVAGMTAHVSKPVDPIALYHLLTRWCDIDVTQLTVGLGAASNGVGATGEITQNTAMLKAFAEDFQGIVDELESIIQRGDITRWHDTLHSLAGCSAAIGANELYESVILSDSDIEFLTLTAVPKALEAGIERTLSQVKDRLDKSLVTDNTSGFNRLNSTSAIISSLTKRIENQEFDLTEDINRLERNLKVDKVELIQDLRLSLENFDFDSSLDICKKIQTFYD
ncbi:hybrid sensor histidine kinase/response regulator [Pseudoalteromonas sp. MMG013]|uniref:hybrid sensor histidine kinase/response regulator n=1 Tax=Pseudoalteromonas sp. MMG013 TaxID=2822687 RepID=UPI001B385A1E|nr:hybrid sensor histidine kinase/response regulator [Pseudoalteromonas sp. MMG013]